MAKAIFDADLLPHLANIFMGAAHADEQLDGREVEAVERLLVGLTKPADGAQEFIRACIKAFNPKKFDITTSVRALGVLSTEQRRALLEQLSELQEADEEIDSREDDFLRKVADAMGSTQEELKGLTIDLETENATPDRAGPPPLP
jgi:uncharacterized tellurite resistance protein B-like protein